MAKKSTKKTAAVVATDTKKRAKTSQGTPDMSTKQESKVETATVEPTPRGYLKERIVNGKKMTEEEYRKFRTS